MHTILNFIVCSRLLSDIYLRIISMNISSPANVGYRYLKRHQYIKIILLSKEFILYLINNKKYILMAY